MTRHFPQPVCQTVVAPGGMSDKPNRKRPPHSSGFRCQASGSADSGRLYPYCMLAGRRGVTSATASAPVFFHLPCIAPPPFPEAFYSLWDGNSTPARCGCQEVITRYCISKQLLRRCSLGGRVFHSGKAGRIFIDLSHVSAESSFCRAIIGRLLPGAVS